MATKRRSVRSNTEVVSDLPPFEVYRSEQFPGWLLVMCPYEDCPSSKDETFFMVHKATWLADLISRFSGGVLTGRSCPYCYRTGRVPKRGVRFRPLRNRDTVV